MFATLFTVNLGVVLSDLYIFSNYPGQILIPRSSRDWRLSFYFI